MRILSEHKAFLPLRGKKGGPVLAVLVISRRKPVSKTFEPPPPPPPEDPKGKGRDFLSELLKVLLFSAAYDLLKWLILNLEKQAMEEDEEEDEVWRPFAA